MFSFPVVAKQATQGREALSYLAVLGDSPNAGQWSGRNLKQLVTSHPHSRANRNELTQSHILLSSLWYISSQSQGAVLPLWVLMPLTMSLPTSTNTVKTVPYRHAQGQPDPDNPPWECCPRWFQTVPSWPLNQPWHGERERGRKRLKTLLMELLSHKGVIFIWVHLITHVRLIWVEPESLRRCQCSFSIENIKNIVITKIHLG